MATDKQLIQQILLGKSEAFGELFRKYQKQIYSICQGIVKNSHDAEELVQEVFVHAYLKLNQLEDKDKFFPWLKKIAQNRSRNYLHRKKETTIPLSQVSIPIMRNVPERTLLKQELVDAVIEAIESLPEKDREVIRAHIDGLSHSEIGERLGISMQASKDRLYRARKRIKARVKELLSTVIGLPNTLPLEKIISGGITAMKLGTTTKISIGVIIAVISGFIGFQVWLHQETQQPEVKPPKKITQQETTRTISQPKTVRPSSDDEESIQFEQYSEEEIEEALAWLDSLEESSQIKSQETSEEEMKEQKISVELKKKIELFNALMRIFPVYEELCQLDYEVGQEITNYIDSLDTDRIDADVGMTHYGSDSEGRIEIIVFDKHGQRIVNDPYLDSFLSELHEKEERAIEIVSRRNAILHEIDGLYPGAVTWWDDVTSVLAIKGMIDVNVLREYLGKELPYPSRGYSSYFDAQDYKP